ncbi:MAG: hypothetical protein ABI155_13190 [Paralcaligenes sp.]
MNDDDKWAVNDIERLHAHLPEIDPSHYFDQREYSALQKALAAWPVLAQLMGLRPPEKP